jgi:hypothetical protein
MRSQKFVAYTATCLAVLGGLALAKPATVHAADTTAKSSWVSEWKADNTQSNIDGYRSVADDAVNAYDAQGKAQVARDQAKADLDTTIADNTKTAEDIAAARTTLNDKETALTKAQADAKAKQAIWDKNRGDVSAATVAKDKADLTAAEAKVQPAIDAYNKATAAYTAAQDQEFGTKLDKIADNGKKQDMTTKVNAFQSAIKDYVSNKGDMSKVLAAGVLMHDAALNNIGSNVDVDYHKLANLYEQQYRAYLAKNADIDAANNLHDKYIRDLAVNNINNYINAKKNDVDAAAKLASAEKAYNLNKDDASLYNAWQSAKSAYAESHPAYEKLNQAMTTYQNSAWDPAKAPVAAADTPVTPSTPVTPNVPVTPSDNNTTNNNTQAQTLYVSYSEHPTWKVATLNDNGVYTDNYVDQNTAITVMQSKTVNGELLYKIADNQWIPAKYTAKQASANAEEAASGVATLNEVPGHPTWKINMLDASGHYTNVYLNPNTAWKVFGKKTINGEVCYRLGSQSQWVPAKYLSLN